MPRKGTEQITIRVTPELKERIEQVAQERVVSVTWLFNRAMEDFLDRLIPLDELVKQRREKRGESID